jgi:predicted O-methyltransferase YrrM
MYDKIVGLNDGPIKYEKCYESAIRMAGAYSPVSIKQNECDFMNNFIMKHQCKTGYEIATAIGISSVCLGLAFKETGGKIVTMDCYLEEEYNSPAGYEHEIRVREDALGYQSVKYLIQQFSLEDILIPRIGFSPRDTQKVLNEEFGDKTLNFVFIDALHSPEAIKADFDSVYNRMSEKFAIFFHDTPCLGDTGNYVQHISKLTFQEAHCPGGFGLGYITNYE